MYKYKVVFTLNGRRFETIVDARTSNDAKILIESQYAGSNVRVLTTTRV